jgi:hypothetical protein
MKAVKDDITIRVIMLPPSPLFFPLGTATPRGFIILPLFSWPAYGPSSIAEMLEGAEGGDGGRPV